MISIVQPSKSRGREFSSDLTFSDRVNGHCPRGHESGWKTSRLRPDFRRSWTHSTHGFEVLVLRAQLLDEVHGNDASPFVISNNMTMFPPLASVQSFRAGVALSNSFQKSLRRTVACSTGSWSNIEGRRTLDGRIPTPSIMTRQLFLLKGYSSPPSPSRLLTSSPTFTKASPRRKRQFIPRKAAVKLTDRARTFFKALLESNPEKLGVILNYQQASSGQPRMVFSFGFVTKDQISPEDEGCVLNVGSLW